MLTKDKYKSDFLKCLEFFDKSYYPLTVLKGKDSFLKKFFKKSKKKDQPHEDEVVVQIWYDALTIFRFISKIQLVLLKLFVKEPNQHPNFRVMKWKFSKERNRYE